MSKKKKPAPGMGDLWVALATILAFQKAHEMGVLDFHAEFERNRRKLIRRVEAFKRDPANWEAIIAERRAAAQQMGRGETKQ